MADESYIPPPRSADYEDQLRTQKIPRELAYDEMIRNWALSAAVKTIRIDWHSTVMIDTHATKILNVARQFERYIRDSE